MLSPQPSAGLPARAVQCARQSPAQVAEQQHLRSASRCLYTRRATAIQIDTHGRGAFAVGWSDSLELAGQRPARSRPHHRQLSPPVVDKTFSVVLSAPNALEALCDNATQIEIDVDIDIDRL